MYESILDRLKDLLVEIEKNPTFESTTTLPALNKGEEVVGSLLHHERQLFNLYTTTSTKFEELLDNHDCEKDHPTLSELHVDMDFYRNLLWWLICHRIDRWDQALALREEFRIVIDTQEDANLS